MPGKSLQTGLHSIGLGFNRLGGAISMHAPVIKNTWNMENLIWPYLLDLESSSATFNEYVFFPRTSSYQGTAAIGEGPRDQTSSVGAYSGSSRIPASWLVCIRFSSTL